MTQPNENHARLEGAIPLTLNGIPVVYLEIPPAECPQGVKLMVFRPGDLAPYNEGFLQPGGALLAVDANVAEKIRGYFRDQITKARAAQASGPH